MSGKISGAVWDLELPVAKRLVLLAMADHADHEGRNVYPSMGLISWKTGYSERHVRRIVGELRTDGLLSVMEEAAGKVTKYRIVISAGIFKTPYKSDSNDTPDTRDTPDIAMSSLPLTPVSATPDIAMSYEPSLNVSSNRQVKPPISPTLLKPADSTPATATAKSGWALEDRVETPKAGHGTITAVHRDTVTVTLDDGKVRDFVPDVLTASTQPAPQADPADVLIDAYVDATKAVKAAVNSKSNREIATALAGQGVTAKQLRDYLIDYAKPEWRTEKIPSFTALGTKLPAWVADHKPKPIIQFDPENPIWQQPTRTDVFRVFDDDGMWIGEGPEAAKELQRRRAERTANGEGVA